MKMSNNAMVDSGLWPEEDYWRVWENIPYSFDLQLPSEIEERVKESRYGNIPECY